MSSQSVWTWLDSVDSSHACYPDSDDNQFERPCKRQRRQRNHANSTSPLRYLLTPAGSGESVSDSASPKLRMNSPTWKRPRDSGEDDDEIDASNIITPRPKHPQYKPASSVSSYTSSSKASKALRPSSPTKQILQTELQTTGFCQATFASDPLPPTLASLRHHLRSTWFGDGILPKCLEPELADLDLPSFFFLDNQDTCRLRFPSRRAIRNIWAQANMHDMESSPEAQWNADVHQPVLDATLKEDGVPVSLLAPHYCVAAPVLVQYRPRDAPSKMVDYCLSIQPCESRHREVIDHIRASRPGCSINHSDQGAQMMKHPIAISIETKRHGEQYDTALLQIATWHSAQWRSLRWGGRDISNIEFLAGLIVQGHDWQFVATAPGDGENGLVRVFRPGIHIGDTRSEEAIYKLLVSLQRLAAWAEDVFWPAFKADFSIPD
ncbi:unnamed protein product [Clonostachys rosea f. rosea IK726]|uniref:Uncharacterized protein n=1 Tax=Clonostachys rosea f. rosea IK726 TaxID=1349383 RepID=A0ACA9UFW3_BIOOC|nr:unnamed protein product [Clonostachys rosea f. rosea IK726]